jgi:FkbM family methyltransferase
MLASFRYSLRRLLLRAGYRVDCIRSVPQVLHTPQRQRRLEFDDVVCRRMVEVGRPLSFLQIGAFDGEMADPLYPFIKKHCWSGVLVEPQPKPFDALRRLHEGNPYIRVVNAAIGERKGKATLYCVDGKELPSWCGGLASFDRESIAKHESMVPGLSDFIVGTEVETVAFSSLLDFDELRGFDLLQVDTEGADAQILGWFPFDRVKPAIVHFEIKHLRMPELNRCLDRLAGFGYRFAPSGGEDLLAVQ